jgi:hypothetical protein
MWCCSISPDHSHTLLLIAGRITHQPQLILTQVSAYGAQFPVVLVAPCNMRSSASGLLSRNREVQVMLTSVYVPYTCRRASQISPTVA